MPRPRRFRAISRGRSQSSSRSKRGLSLSSRRRSRGRSRSRRGLSCRRSCRGRSPSRRGLSRGRSNRGTRRSSSQSSDPLRAWSSRAARAAPSSEQQPPAPSSGAAARAAEPRRGLPAAGVVFQQQVLKLNDPELSVGDAIKYFGEYGHVSAIWGDPKSGDHPYTVAVRRDAIHQGRANPLLYVTINPVIPISSDSDCKEFKKSTAAKLKYKG